MGRYISKAVRDEVFERDRGRCQLCGSTSNLEFDHITPFSKGTPATAGNLQLLCHQCNRMKRDKTKKCPECSSWIAHDAAFCHSCGRMVPHRIRNSPVVDSVSRWSLANYVGLLILIGIGLYLLASWFVPQFFR